MIVPPRPDPRGFRRELTPTWLATATLLARHRPPDLSHSFRVAYLGCGTGVTPAVVAAVHPDCEVWAWDPRLNQVESTRRLRDAAGLDNLIVYERPGLPDQLGDGLYDVIVTAGVLDVVSDQLRAQIIDAAATTLRPGGVLCVTYRTTVGWSEIAPVHRLIRYVALRDKGDPDGLVDRVLDLLRQLHDGGAGYLTQRPVVAAWLAALSDADPAVITTEYLIDDMRPISHNEVVSWFSPSGCAYVGSSRLTDDLDLDLSPALAEVIRTAPSPTLREAYRDICVRRATRADLFRLGAAPLAPPEYAQMLASLDLIALHGAEPSDDPEAVRVMLTAGRAHPRAQGDVAPAAESRSRSLTNELAESSEPLVATPQIGSAIEGVSKS